MGYAKIYKRWIQKKSRINKKREKKKMRKDNPCSRKKYSIREKYISKSIVELG